MTDKQYPPLCIGIVAGEVSGDCLGADFMAKMNALHPHIRWVGVGGEQMAKQGLESMIAMQRLAVMGIFEVASHLPDLIAAKRTLLANLHAAKIDIFVGIDAPDFNLRLAKVLKKRGVFCVQYVSPSIWAWREKRIHAIKRATHLVLCLFPFELPVYHKHRHTAVCVGHPLVHSLGVSFYQQKKSYIHELLDKPSDDTRVFGLLAGSRVSEIKAILPILLAGFGRIVADSLNENSGLNKKGLNKKICALLPLADDSHAKLVHALIDKHAPHLRKHLHIKRPSLWHNQAISLAQAVMASSHAVILASGTASLECMLIGTPMVVVYRLNPVSFALARRLVKIPFVALPNIINHVHGIQPEVSVPELLQQHATADNIAQAVAKILANPTIWQQHLQRLSHYLISTSHHDPAHALWQAFCQYQLQRQPQQNQSR